MGSTSRTIALVFGAAFAAVAFGAAGGTQLGRTTWVEILLVLGGTGVIAAALLRGRPGPLYGGAALFAFALLVVLTALSITWSVVPELSYIEAGRTFAWFVVFAAAIAGARLAPRGAPGLLGAILVGSLLPVLYSLASRIWPGTIAENELSNRIGAPFQYWNAVGSVAAIAIPAALWLGSRRSGSMYLRALAYPAVAACVLAILLTQSRGALVAAAVAALIWLALVPLRLRTLPVILIPSVLAVGVGAWALSKDVFSKSLQPLEAKEALAGDFGLLVLLMLLVSYAAGYGVCLAEARGVISMRTRRRLGIVAVAGACLVPLVAFTSVAFSDRGLTGTIDDRVSQLTSETEIAPEEGGDRVFASSSTRGKYWREADRVFDDRPIAGVGAGSFAVARLRHRTDSSVTRHAHGHLAQTAADLGVLGLLVTGFLFFAWLAASLRTTSLIPRRLRPPSRNGGLPPRRDWHPDRTALLAVGLGAVAFGLQSTIDWTWFIPGPAVLALAAGGFVAGRGPEGALLAEPERGLRFGELGERTRRLALWALGIAAAIGCWMIWQPYASHRATDEALDLADQGRYSAAFASTRDAAQSNPLTPEPLFIEASLLTAQGRDAEALSTLEQAVLAFPGDPQTWFRLASFQLHTLDRPLDALDTIRGALYLDPHSLSSRQLFLDAKARQRAKDEANGAATPAPGEATPAPDAPAPAPAAPAEPSTGDSPERGDGGGATAPAP